MELSPDPDALLWLSNQGGHLFSQEPFTCALRGA